MRSRDENLTRFVRHVHHRLVLTRALERGGACVGVASVFACLFAGIALIQGRDAMQLVIPILALGAIIGMVWGLVRRPTRFDAVTEADRQLALSDLLATAYLQRGADDPWQLAVVAIADERCRTLSPAAVVVHRYGGRAWGGIGLAAATGLTLALLSGVPQDSRARPADVRRPMATNTDATRDRENLMTPGFRDKPSPAQRTGKAERQLATASESTASEDSGDGKTDAGLTRPGNESASGDGSGETAPSSGEPLPRPAAVGESPRHPDASPAGGGAAKATSAGGSGEDASSGTSTLAGVSSTAKPPPWAASSWPSDRAAAAEAVRSGRVPDAYRDVVQEYFTAGDPDGR